jgi:endonuclease/exonuclease/phosphatase family metal-dependent hydrolase
MLRLVWFLVLVCFAMTTGLPAVAQAAPSLKCLTFNILHGGVFSGLRGNAQDLDRRLEIAVEEIRALQPDIIGLQEASTGRQRGNVAERLATELGFHYVYAPASFRLFASEILNNVIGWVMNLTEGPAIISRFPIVSSETYDLPRCGRFTDPRVLLCAELETPWGRVRACSTHISGDALTPSSLLLLLLSLRGKPVS